VAAASELAKVEELHHSSSVLLDLLRKRAEFGDWTDEEWEAALAPARP
jgi:hypothetical protein